MEITRITKTIYNSNQDILKNKFRDLEYWCGLNNYIITYYSKFFDECYGLGLTVEMVRKDE